MNSEKDLKNNFPNKKTKTKKQNPKISNDNLGSQKIDKNEEEINLLNKKKKREENELNNNDKIEINQNMFNQYNFYQGLFISPNVMQMQPINNKDSNYQEIYQNIYYINNPYEFFPNEELQNFCPEPKTENNGGGGGGINLKDINNNIYKRGIVNNIIGAFFIEEYNEKKNNLIEEEKIINNNNKTNNEIKKEITFNLNNENHNNNDNNKENENENINDNKNIKNNNLNEPNDESNSNNDNKLRKPILIW